jgi:phosphoribosylaminoimidazole-succinocarboxamide synthase
MPPSHKGKVRDLYDLRDSYLIVASDRISAYDHVLPDEIPLKGEVLTKLSLFWFEYLSDIVEDHLLSVDISGLPEEFTPSTKATIGHDMNISVDEMNEIVGEEMGFVLEQKSLELYAAAAAYAESRGIIIADTKFEFGLIDGHVILVDEVLTPDSSRFWPLDGYQPGRPQASFDKQYVRDWLTSSGWDKRAPAPRMPADVMANTSAKYEQAYQMLTGEKFVPEGS